VICTEVNKISQGRPHILDKIEDGQVQWILNTSAGTRTTEDSYIIRRAALDYHIPYTTTITGGLAMTQAMESLRQKEIGVKTIQEFAKSID
jgi:carbamoyl-phosphate synthase large subunit